MKKVSIFQTVPRAILSLDFFINFFLLGEPDSNPGQLRPLSGVAQLP
jgi:hypothetical protein